MGMVGPSGVKDTRLFDSPKRYVRDSRDDARTCLLLDGACLGSTQQYVWKWVFREWLLLSGERSGWSLEAQTCACRGHQEAK